MAETQPWDPSSPEYSHQDQSMFYYREQFVHPNTPARELLYIKSVTSYAYDAADVMDDDSYATAMDTAWGKHSGLDQMITSYGIGDFCIMCSVINCLPLKSLGKAIGAHRYLPLTLVGHAHFQ